LPTAVKPHAPPIYRRRSPQHVIWSRPNPSEKSWQKSRLSQ
jgi:hypothetical protein